VPYIREEGTIEMVINDFFSGNFYYCVGAGIAQSL
jgi:hypothetical protein